jgi:hypothetical protein
MECACIEAHDGDFATMLFDKKVVARKKHKCCECRRAIERGETYRKESALYDGTITTYKTCIDCNGIRDAFVCTFAWGEVLEAVENAIYDYGCDISESGIASLTPAARERVCGWIEDCWDRESEDED